VPGLRYPQKLNLKWDSEGKGTQHMKHTLLSLGYLVLCTSCSPHHDTNKVLPNEETFLAHEISPSREQAIPLPEKWWESLNDQNLNRLIEEALGSNFSFKSTWDRLTQAGATLRREGAPLYPDIEVSNSNQRAELRQFFGDQVRTNWRSNFIMRLTASYELDVWGRLHAIRNAAQMNFKATEQELYTAAISLSSEIASTWYDVVELTYQLKLLSAQEDINKKTLSLILLRFSNGQVSIVDILRQEQLVESIESEKERISAQLKVSKNQLSILRGKTPSSDTFWTSKNKEEQEKLIDESIQALILLPPPPETGIPADLLTRRPDIRQSLYLVEEANHRLASAIADRLPRLSFTAGVSTNTTEFREVLDDWLMNFASNIVGPLFDAGLRAAEVDRSKAVLSERLNLYSNTILESVAEVDNALTREHHQKRTLESLERQLSISEKVQSRIQARYAKGLVEYLDVLTALTNTQSLERNILTARRELLTFRLSLYRALAGSWDIAVPATDDTLKSTQELEKSSATS
jgi:NodT family efflux transporter outer membrane factor (OMF) lipoprotein